MKKNKLWILSFLCAPIVITGVIVTSYTIQCNAVGFSLSVNFENTPPSPYQNNFWIIWMSDISSTDNNDLVINWNDSSFDYEGGGKVDNNKFSIIEDDRTPIDMQSIGISFDNSFKYNTNIDEHGLTYYTLTTTFHYDGTYSGGTSINIGFDILYNNKKLQGIMPSYDSGLGIGNVVCILGF